MIPFNKPFLAGNELTYIRQAVESGKISGNGNFTQLCQKFFEERFGFHNVLLTNSCTDALEMAAILCDIKPGDEVIVPSFTFVSTANAFVLRGAKIVFADAKNDHPNMDADSIEELISPKTKAIVVLHYGGVACDMEKIAELAKKYSNQYGREIFIVEDAAHSIGSYHREKPLGSFGHFAAFSFHETKNIISGEGGMLVINDKRFDQRAEVIWEKGTNRAAYFRNEISKYEWIDIGSSYLPSEITAAFLFGQLEQFEKISIRRAELWNLYAAVFSNLPPHDWFSLPAIPHDAGHNHHIFYLQCKNSGERDELINYLKGRNIIAVSHYLPLHLSPFYNAAHNDRLLSNSVRFSETIIRLPLFHELSEAAINEIFLNVVSFYQNR